MWNKRDEEMVRPVAPAFAGGSQPAQPAPSPPPVPDRHEAAGIGASIKIVGDVTGDEDLTILGKIEGKIVLPKHSVTIGQSGRVKADIQAKFVSVAGEVHGNLIAGEQIVIRKTATMLGNLTAPRVGLEDGCRFRGAVEMEAPAEKGRPASSQPAASSAGSSSGSAVASAVSAAHGSAKPEPTAHS
jgi:cytoskeletal protein CcmA (bactofilin family)